MVRSVGTLLLIAATLAASIGALELLPEPWIGIAAILAAASIVCAVRARSTAGRLAAAYGAVAIATLGGFEAWLWLASRGAPVESYEGDYKVDYFVDDDDLGYVPQAGRAFTSTKKLDGEAIYTTRYTIGADGLRVTPAPAAAAAGSVLFFGDSYTVGEGLPDDATLPWLVGSELDGRLRAYNFGFHGYGPHQMLAMLQSGRVAQRVAEPPVLAVYSAITDHVARVRGREWDKHGPRYRLKDDGRLVRKGQFDEARGPFAAAAHARLERSRIFRRTLGSERPMDPEDMAVYLAVVAEARNEVAARFPGCRFEVLLWGGKSSATARRIANGLRERGIAVHREMEFLPDYARHRDRYVLSPRDAHPNAAANREIARFVAERVVGRPGAPAPALDTVLPDVAGRGEP
jgi:hypothetical protein